MGKNNDDSTGQPKNGFCIFIDTFFQGPVPTVRDGDGKYVVFATELEAQREIADYAITRLQQFLDEKRDFEDAITVEEYVVAVQIFPDGRMVDEAGNYFDMCAE